MCRRAAFFLKDRPKCPFPKVFGGRHQPRPLSAKRPPAGAGPPKHTLFPQAAEQRAAPQAHPSRKRRAPFPQKAWFGRLSQPDRPYPPKTAACLRGCPCAAAFFLKNRPKCPFPKAFDGRHQPAPAFRKAAASGRRSAKAHPFSASGRTAGGASSSPIPQKVRTIPAKSMVRPPESTRPPISSKNSGVPSGLPMCRRIFPEKPAEMPFPESIRWPASAGARFPQSGRQRAQVRQSTPFFRKRPNGGRRLKLTHPAKGAHHSRKKHGSAV